MEVYAAMIDCMDQGIARVVEALEKNGQFENTLILYFQDNGGCHEALGRQPRKDAVEGIRPMGRDELQKKMIPERTRDGKPVLTGPDVMPGPADTYIAYGRNWANVSNTPFREYKSHNHEGGIASPLIAHWPQGIRAANELRHQPTHLIDIMPTVVELAGASYPQSHAKHRIQPMEGLSLVPGFARDHAPDRVLLWEHYGKAAIRKGPWKLVRLGHREPWELYEIDRDRSELHDLAAEQPEKAEELRSLWKYHAWRTRIYPHPGDGR